MLVENGEHAWSDLARLMGKEAVKLGYISDPKEAAFSKNEALEAAGFEAVSWGLNSRGKAERASIYLDWKPKQHSIEEEVPTILKRSLQDFERETFLRCTSSKFGTTEGIHEVHSVQLE